MRAASRSVNNSFVDYIRLVKSHKSHKMKIFIGNDLDDQFYTNAYIIDFNLEEDVYWIEYTTYYGERVKRSMNMSNLLGIFDMTLFQLARKIFCRKINKITSQQITFNDKKLYIYDKRLKVTDIDIIGTNENCETFLVMDYRHDIRKLELISHETLVKLVSESDYPFPPFSLIKSLGIPKSLSDIYSFHSVDCID